MVQTFDFMSKNYKHVIIQKVTFSTKKELLTQPYTRKPCCIYTPISLSTQRLFCVHSLCPIYSNLFLIG